MNYYIGLDVSQRQTAICVVDEKGKIVGEGKALTLPSDIRGWLIAPDITVASAAVTRLARIEPRILPW